MVSQCCFGFCIGICGGVVLEVRGTRFVGDCWSAGGGLWILLCWCFD